jgi:hypothetical protein
VNKCDCDRCDGKCRKRQIAVIQSEAVHLSHAAHSLQQNKNNILYNVRNLTSTNAVTRGR